MVFMRGKTRWDVNLDNCDLGLRGAIQLTVMGHELALSEWPSRVTAPELQFSSRFRFASAKWDERSVNESP